jgi:hypothetical protein
VVIDVDRLGSDPQWMPQYGELAVVDVMLAAVVRRVGLVPAELDAARPTGATRATAAAMVASARFLVTFMALFPSVTPARTGCPGRA